MELITALLAQAATQDSAGLMNVLGAGVDTLRIPPSAPPDVPLGFMASLVLRFAVNRSECNRPHPVEIVVLNVDGSELSRITVSIVPQIPQGHPVGWDIPYGMIASLNPLVVPGLGEYAINILADGSYKGTLPFRAITDPNAPPGQMIAPPGTPPPSTPAP